MLGELGQNQGEIQSVSVSSDEKKSSTFGQTKEGRELDLEEFWRNEN